MNHGAYLASPPVAANKSEKDNDIVLSLDAFVRSVGVRRATPPRTLSWCGSIRQLRNSIGP